MIRPQIATRLVLGAILIGTMLRFAGLNSNSLVGDEIASLAIATGHHWSNPTTTQPIPTTNAYRTFISMEPGYLSQRLLSVLKSESQMPLYYFLLNLSLHFLGASEVGLRSISALAGVAAIPLTYLLGRRLLSVEAGVYASLILAVAPFQVVYSQFARPYTLLLFFSILATLLLFRLIRVQRTLASFAAYSFVALLGLYTHYLFLWNLVFHWLLVLIHERRSPAFLLRWVCAHLILAGLLLPWIPIFLDQLHWNQQSNALNLFYWVSGALPLSRVLLYVGRDVSLFLSVGRLEGLCSALPSHVCAVDTILTWLAYAVPVLLVAASTVMLLLVLRLTLPSKNPNCLVGGICLLWGFCVFVGPIIIDMLTNVHTIQLPYHFIAATAPLYLFVAIAISSLPTLALRGWMVSALLFFLMAGTVLSIQGHAKTLKYEQGFRELARHIDLSAQKNDLILMTHPGLNPLNLAYYLRSDIPITTVLDDTVSWRDPQQVVARIQRLTSGRSRVWFMDDRGSENPRWIDWLNGHCTLIGTRQFKNLDLLLFSDCHTDRGHSLDPHPRSNLGSRGKAGHDVPGALLDQSLADRGTAGWA